jgi:hypothetical protein
MTRWKLLLMLSSSPLGGCAALPGGACNPDAESDSCVGDGYYCAPVGVCTKTCAVQSDCRVPCSNEACGCGSLLCSPQCDEDGYCLPALNCVDDFCQNDCALDGSCNYDAYAPRELECEKADHTAPSYCGEDPYAPRPEED